MCLAIPMKLIQREEIQGTVEVDGVRREVSLLLLDDARVGEYLLVHAGYAIGRVDETEALETLALLRAVADAGETTA
jgi:hydrogenase expression/formation protein HypC